MRRIFAALLAVLMILSVVYVGVFTVSAETSSELPANARPIKDGDDFLSMQAGGYYYLEADITVDFTYSKNFTGTLDGQGHSVTVTMPLFSNLNGATVRNLVIEGEIDDTEFENVYVGSLANAAGNGLIENVHNKANIIGYKKGNVGGLIGYNRGGTNLNIVNCSNSGELTGVRVGGIVAQSEGENVNITGCKNTGKINRISGNNGFGGILATMSNSNGILHINDCVNTGDITGGRPGGIIGDTTVKELVITDCINTGNITSLNNYAGGIGSRPESLTRSVYRNCINAGTVTSFQSHCGGIVAYSADSATGYDGHHLFYGCVNIGTVQLMDYETSTTGCNVGGIAGRIYGRGEFYNCVSAGNVYGTSFAAGLVAHVGRGGWNGHIISGCYIGGNIYSNAAAFTTPTSYAPAAGFASYMYSYCTATNNFINADIKTDYDIPATSNSDTATISAMLGYSNNSSTMMNNYFTGTLTAGKNLAKIMCINSRGADMSAKFGVTFYNNYSATKDLSLYFNLTGGLSDLKAPTINKADYTDEKIVETLNKGLGYEAYTLLTEEDANEYGFVGIFPTSAVAGISDSSATPVAVGTAEEFLAMKSNGSYYLSADITLPSSYSGVFSGILDGRDHTITVTNPVFDVLSDASVSNLTIKGTIVSEVEAKTHSIADYRGALANIGLTTVVTKVTNEANVSAYSEAGGIFAQMQGGKLVDCVNKGTITGNTYVGGFVGNATNEVVTFENCVNNGTLKKGSATGSNFGGIVGYLFYTDAHFNGCVNNKAIEITSSNANVGGLLGYAYALIRTTENGEMNQSRLLKCDVVMTDCVNNGNITGYNYVGGLAAGGEVEFTFTDCVNNAEVVSVQNFAGGLVGYAGTSIQNPEAIHTFENCVNNGDVTAHRQYAGGIIAYAKDNVTFVECVNTAAVGGEDVSLAKLCSDYKCHSGKNYRYIVAGGIVGRSHLDSKFEECVNLGAISGNCMVGGLAGEIGFGVAKGIDGKHEFIRCQVGGSVYNSNLYYAKETAHMYGTGGLFGTATNALTGEITVQYCAVTASVTGTTTAIDSPCAISGLGGYCNTADAFFLNNYFAGNLIDAGKGYGVRSLVVYSSTTLLRAANVKDNFTTNNSLVIYHDARGITSLSEDSYVSGGAASGELCFRLYDSIGKDVFFQQLGVDAYPSPFEGETKYMVRYDKTVPEYYNITRLSDVRPDPDQITTEDNSGDIDDPSDDYTTEEQDPIPSNPADTTTEENPPVVTDPTTEPVTDPVTEPVTDEATEPTKEGGCGSVIGASLALAAFALIAPAAVLLKKRDEE